MIIFILKKKEKKKEYIFFKSNFFIGIEYVLKICLFFYFLN